MENAAFGQTVSTKKKSILENNPFRIFKNGNVLIFFKSRQCFYTKYSHIYINNLSVVYPHLKKSLHLV